MVNKVVIWRCDIPKAVRVPISLRRLNTARAWVSKMAIIARNMKRLYVIYFCTISVFIISSRSKNRAFSSI